MQKKAILITEKNGIQCYPVSLLSRGKTAVTILNDTIYIDDEALEKAGLNKTEIQVIESAKDRLEIEKGQFIQRIFIRCELHSGICKDCQMIANPHRA